MHHHSFCSDNFQARHLDRAWTVIMTCCVCVATQRVCVSLAAALASETCREIRRLSSPLFCVSLAGGESTSPAASVT